MAIDKKITRRHLVTLLSQLTAGLSLLTLNSISRASGIKTQAADSSPIKGTSIFDCIIIGAGVSGLTVAQQLKSKSVLILESSNRIGGRIFTDRSSFSRQIERGAEFVHIDPLVAPLWRDLYKYTLKVKSLTKTDGYIYHPEIKKTKAKGTISAAFKWGIINALTVFNSIKYKGKVDISAQEYLEKFKQEENPSQLSYDFRRMILSGHLGAPEELLSMKGFYTDHISEQLEPNMEYYVRNGYGTLIDNLSVDQKILTNQKVQKVIRIGDVYTIETQGGESYRARSICYSASVGVLKNNAIEFVPALPQSKLAAIAHLEMSHHTKIQLEFSRAFWPKDMSMLNRADQGRRVGKTYFVPHTENKEAPPMLTALIMGHDAIKLYTQDEDKIIRDICLDLQECLPKGGDVYDLLNRTAEGKPAVTITQWFDNPHTKGGISYIKKDLNNELSVKEVRSTYASSYETPGLFWAGEAAAIYEQPASVHGAHSAGLRASIEIQNFLDGMPALDSKKLAKAYHQKFGVKNQMKWFSNITRTSSGYFDDENSWYERFASLLY